MKTQHTQGKWEYKKGSKYQFPKVSLNGYDLIINSTTESLEESEANAKLIAEAGTVANETGYTPRQLANQKTELLEALKSIIACYNSGMVNPIDNMAEIAQSAIKEVTGIKL